MTTNPATDPTYGTFGPAGLAAAPAGPEPVPPQPAGPPSPPVFGRRKSEDTVKRISFVLLAYDGANTEIRNQLTARADIDTASVFSLGRSGQNLGVQIEAIRKLLMRVLVDDDGIGVHERVQQVVPRPGSDDEDDLVPVDELPDDATWSMADVAFRAPDGEVFDDAADAADHVREHGSSLNRFAAIMDDDSLWVEQSALEEIIDYLMSQAADRPTRRSSARSRSRQRTGR